MSEQKSSADEAGQVIGNLGGTAKTAEICDVSAAAVSQWRLNGIPKAQRKYLLAVRPEAFADQPAADAAQ